MKILVCITHVPDTTARIAFQADGLSLDRSGVSFIIGPYDDYALARAVELKASASDVELVVLHVGGAEAEASLRKALAIGADRAVRIAVDEAVDAAFVAREIAAYAETAGGFDLIMMGRESIDFNGGLVHGMVGRLLGVTALSPVMKLSLEGRQARLSCEIAGGSEELEASLPLVLGCQEPIADWKIPNMRGIMMARSKPLEVRQPVAQLATVGVRTLRFTLPPPRAALRMVDAQEPEELVRLLQEEAGAL